MRWLGLSVCVLAGCTEAGAHLTFSAPDGPSKVTSFRVVLATPDRVPSVEHQRVDPGSMETQAVSYYLQRTVAGGTQGRIDGVDGFAVRIEPDPAMSETQFIPFVLMYERDAEGTDRIVGVATFRAPDSTQPSPILVVREEIDKYVLDVEPTVQVDDVAPVDVGQVRVVECYRDDQTKYPSGIVWRPRRGGEIRLLFPDDGGSDATGRALDLDCDERAVTVDSSSPDCDDTRAWFHSDAEETCDGYDTNCDGLQNLVVACPASSGTNVCVDPVTNTGLALCDDRTGTQTACISDPQCLCANSPTGCTRCVIASEAGTTAATVKPCQPGIGYVYLTGLCGDAERCQRVEVLSVGGGWKAEVSPDVQPYAFALAATNVGPKAVLRVRRGEGPGAEIPGVLGASTGEVVLGIVTADGQAHLKAIDLQIDADSGTCQGTGPFQMFCTP